MTQRTNSPDRDDDFGGIGRGRAAIILFVAAVTHPGEAFRELLDALRRRVRRSLRVALAPFARLRLRLWSRGRDRRPSFDDYLRHPPGHSPEREDRP